MRYRVRLLAALVLLVMVSFLVAEATHVIGDDVPPGADSDAVAALLGQLPHGASFVSATSPEADTPYNLPPGTYGFSFKGGFSGGTPTSKNIRVVDTGGTVNRLEIRYTVANATWWFSQFNTAISDAGVHYAAMNGSEWTVNAWFTNSAQLNDVSIHSHTVGGSTQRHYNQSVESSCAGINELVTAQKFSGTLTACVVDLASAFIPPLDAPTLTATPGEESAFLSWTASDGADYYTVVMDTVSHPGATSSAQYATLVDVVTTTSYLVDGLTNGVPYYFRVEAANTTYFTSALSNEATATPSTAPVLTGRGFREMAILTWTDGGMLDALNVQLYRGNSTANLTLYQTFLGSARGYNDSMSAGEAWYYAVRLANGSATSPYSNVVYIPYPAPPPPLFGEDGVVYGADGRAALANELRITATALDFLYGLTFVIGMAITGFGATRPWSLELYGSLVGAVVGVFLAMGFGFWPVWAVVFVLACGLALYFLAGRRV